MTAALRLGLVGPVPPPAGGMAMQTAQLQELLVAEGLSVELVPTNPPYSPAWIGRLPGLRSIFRLIPYLFRLWRLAGRVDVIHVMSNSGWSWQLFSAPMVWIGSMRKTPVIINYRGGEAATYFSKSIARVRPSMKRASCLVVPSGYLRQVFADYGLQAEVIPNIVRLERFVEPERREQGQLRLIITRNLEAIYGIPTAIRAVQLIADTVPSARLDIAGSGPQRGELEALVGKLGLGNRVRFLGRLGSAEIDTLYQSADILLNPTTVDNMPNSLLEAMAAGVAIVSTRVGGVPFIVEHGRTALLTEIGDARQMADAVIRLYRDRRLRQALVDNALQDVQQYAWPEVRNQWLSLYQSVRKNRRGDGSP